jgi:hypothetical protein
MRSPTLANWTFLALAGLVAGLFNMALHELGHGITALMLGGEFHDLFVSPLGGQAGASAPGPLNTIVLASGSLLDLISGAIAFSWLRRRQASPDVPESLDPAAVFAWMFATKAIFGVLVYVCFQPAIQGIFGVATGDWPQLLVSSAGLKWLLLALGILIVGPVAAALLRQARLLVPPRFAGSIGSSMMAQEQWQRNALSAYVAFVIFRLPSVLLRSAFAIVLVPWLDSPLPLTLGSIWVVFVIGVPGAIWIAWRDRQAPSALDLDTGDTTDSDRAGEQLPSYTPAWQWNIGLATVAALTLTIFGPTEQLRQGLALTPPNGDQYIFAAQRITLQLEWPDSGAPVVTLRSNPRPAGSRYRRQITAELASLGPSVKGARELSAFIARWNLGGTEPGPIYAPFFEYGAWVWQFELLHMSEPLNIAFWPVTWVRESRIEELRIPGGVICNGEVPHVKLEEGAPSVLVWTRPESMDDVQRFQVRLKQAC